MALREKSHWFMLLCLLFVISCGSDKSKPEAKSSRNELQDDSQSLYRAILRPLNESVGGSTRGVVIVRVDGDEIVVEETVSNAPAGIRHYQYIMDGSACPTVDANGDSYIDIKEAESVIGKILIPLDSNLDSQLDGFDYGPIANAAGAFVYRKTASVARMSEDLYIEDPNPQDDLVKLGAEGRFAMNGKVVVIHGVGYGLPSSVATRDGMSASESLPIACGQLTRISSEDQEVEL